MPGTTSTALPSFSHDQQHKTDAAKRKGGGLQMNLTTQVILRQLQAVTCPGNHCGFELKEWNRNAEIRQLLGLESVSLVINQGR